MEILLIGNGFDLAHGLPTKYRDFLDFCQGIEILYSEPFASLKDYRKKLEETMREDVSPQVLHICTQAFHYKNIDETLSDSDQCIQQRSTLRELHILIDRNTWIWYFKQRSSYIGENWIDFESEISKAIQALDATQGEVLSEEQDDPEADNLAIAIWQAVEWNRKDNYIYRVNDNFIKFLDDELTRLIRALEIYIANYINKMQVVQKNPDIERLHPDHVLSFNYSNTYERVYDSGKSIAYDYIHGKAKLGNNKDNCNLVLGIDEYLDDKRKNTDLQFLTFKKFYQRTLKSTDSQYLNWIDEIRSSKEPSTLYIFGHSLDITDRDVLQPFIGRWDIQVKIFYYQRYHDDKQALGKLIRNLIRILGQEELIQRTSSGNIEFIPQTITT